jgi:inosose dehydratase
MRGAVLKNLAWNSDSFLDAVLKGVYTVPRDGSIDFAAIVARLASIGYEGWFVVEAEQDPIKAPPLEYARIGHRALSADLRQAGYQVQEYPEAMAGAAAIRPASGA